MKTLALLAAFCLTQMVPLSALAENATLERAVAAARQFRQANEFEILNEFRDLLRFPNNAQKLEDMRKNAAFIQQMMAARGIKTELLEIAGAPPRPSSTAPSKPA